MDAHMASDRYEIGNGILLTFKPILGKMFKCWNLLFFERLSLVSARL